MRRLSLIVLLLAAGCSDGCGNTIVSSKAAPDGRRSAVLFQRDCGATTGFTTQVSILDSGRPLTGGGNVFTADDDNGAAQAAPWGGPWAELVWVSPNHLLVRHDAKARVFLQNEDISGVQVRFEPVTRP